jgi:diguanylate cyclase (GGDEF)-like protein
VARLGGDEFILLLTQSSSPEDAQSAARRILDSFREPFQVKERPLSITASMGIAVYPEHGEDPETLVKHADVAMYRAKETGRNRMVFFAPESFQSEA